MFSFLVFLMTSAVAVSESDQILIDCVRSNKSHITVNFSREYPRIGTMTLVKSINTSFGHLPPHEYEVVGFVEDGIYGADLPANAVVHYFTFPEYVTKNYSFRIRADLDQNRSVLILSAAHPTGIEIFFYVERIKCHLSAVTSEN